MAVGRGMGGVTGQTFSLGKGRVDVFRGPGLVAAAAERGPGRVFFLCPRWRMAGGTFPPRHRLVDHGPQEAFVRAAVGIMAGGTAPGHGLAGMGGAQGGGGRVMAAAAKAPLVGNEQAGHGPAVGTVAGGAALGGRGVDHGPGKFLVLMAAETDRTFVRPQEGRLPAVMGGVAGGTTPLGKRGMDHCGARRVPGPGVTFPTEVRRRDPELDTTDHAVGKVAGPAVFCRHRRVDMACKQALPVFGVTIQAALAPGLFGRHRGLGHAGGTKKNGQQQAAQYSHRFLSRLRLTGMGPGLVAAAGTRFNPHRGKGRLPGRGGRLCGPPAFRHHH